MSDEQQALNELKQKKDALKILAFDSLIRCLKMSPIDLKYRGLKTIQDAVMYTLGYRRKEIKKLEDEFFKHFPD